MIIGRCQVLQPRIWTKPVMVKKSLKLKKIISCRFCSSVSKENINVKEDKKYKHTLNIPSSTFPRNPVGAKRRTIEKEVHCKAGFSSLYEEQSKKSKSPYILHDGPPYANGKLHIGHSLNKILKDIVIRYQVIRGNSVHFVPGWDCHGLPIELKALQKLRKSKSMRPMESPNGIRSIARKFSEDALTTQLASFKDWGIMANWEDIYTTTSSSYVKKELQLFGQLYEEGFIFQSYLPVHFSPSSRSCLAESELEYKEDHKSPSLYLAMPLTTDSCLKIVEQYPILSGKPLYLCIWTTTPWTLPANMAVCVSRDSEYNIISLKRNGKQEYYIWSKDLINVFEEILSKDYTILSEFKGSSLVGFEYIQPLNGKKCPVWTGSHVKMSKGTGVVHTAPAHGKEDFFLALENSQRDVEELVGDDGCYTHASGPLLRGKSVLDGGNETVIDIINNSTDDNASHILNLGEIIHSYPYDWRTKKPTIVRASKQWFFDIEKVKEAALEALNQVTIEPCHHIQNYRNSIGSRPYWCLSRQRSWGVPIPVFYDCETHEPIMNREIIDHLSNLFATNGADIWWEYPEEELLPPEFVENARKEGKPLPKKGKDILDIWFDSGASNHCVLNGKTADLVIEGIDQINGWFQSSLLISVAANRKAPFKKLVLHSFVVDDKHEKMSKSLGNVFDPVLITEGSKAKRISVYGVNILRLWVVQSTATKFVPFGIETLKKCENQLISLRSTFWFMLSTMKLVSKSEKPLPAEFFRLQDKYVLHMLKNKLPFIWDQYERGYYHVAFKMAYDLIVQDIGREYINSVKDTLLCENEGHNFESILTTLNCILPQLLRIVAPIVPHLVEEVYLHYPVQHEGLGVFRSYTNEPPDEWHMPSSAELFMLVRPIHDKLQSWFEDNRHTIKSANSQVFLKYGPSYAEVLETLQNTKTESHSELCSYFNVAEVILDYCPDMEQFAFEIKEADKSLCARCFKKTAPTGDDLCVRCKNVLEILK